MANTANSTTVAVKDQPSGSAYTCPFFSCDLWVAQDAASFKIHTLLHHPNAYSLPCAFCSEKFDKVDTVISHIDQYHKEPKLVVTFRSYQCGFQDCWMACESAIDFLTHNQKAHPNEKSFACCYCKHAFCTLAELVLHIDENVLYSCVGCPKVTESRYNDIRKHVVNSEHGSNMFMATGQVDTEIKLQIKCVFSDESGEMRYKAIKRIILVQNVSDLGNDKTPFKPDKEKDIVEEIGSDENQDCEAKSDHSHIHIENFETSLDKTEISQTDNGTTHVSMNAGNDKKERVAEEPTQVHVQESMEIETHQEEELHEDEDNYSDMGTKTMPEEVTDMPETAAKAKSDPFTFLGKGELLRCDQCTFQTEFKMIREIHNKVHLTAQDQGRMLCCPHCPYSTNALAPFKIHVQSHSEKAKIRIYSCGYCSLSSNKMDHVEDHHEEVHGDLELKSDVTRLAVQNMLFECHICPFSDGSEAQLIAHLEEKHKRFSVQVYLKETYDIEGLEDCTDVSEKTKGEVEEKQDRIDVSEKTKGEVEEKQDCTDIAAKTKGDVEEKQDCTDVAEKTKGEIQEKQDCTDVSEKTKGEIQEKQDCTDVSEKTKAKVEEKQDCTDVSEKTKAKVEEKQVVIKLEKIDLKISPEMVAKKLKIKTERIDFDDCSKSVGLNLTSRSNQEEFTCDFCSFVTNQKEKLEEHWVMHEGQTMSSMLASNEQDDESDFTEGQGQSTANQGKNCNYSQETMDLLDQSIFSLRNHYTITSRVMRCPICPVSTTTRSFMIKHLNFHKTSAYFINGYKCGYCEYITEGEGPLTRHIHREHGKCAQKKITIGNAKLRDPRELFLAEGQMEGTSFSQKADLTLPSQGIPKPAALVKPTSGYLSRSEEYVPVHGAKLEYTPEIINMLNKRIAEILAWDKDSPYTGALRCPLCPYSASKSGVSDAKGKWGIKSHLELHLTQSAIENGYRCAYCLYTTQSLPAMTTHLIRYHQNLPPRRITLGDPNLIPKKTYKPTYEYIEEDDDNSVVVENSGRYGGPEDRWIRLKQRSERIEADAANLEESENAPDEGTDLEYTEEILNRLREVIAELENKDQPYTGPNECTVCPYKNLNYGRKPLKEHLQRHIAQATMIHGWRCGYCLYTCEARTSIIIHLNRYHAKQAVRYKALGDAKTETAWTKSFDNIEDFVPEEGTELKYTEEILTKLKDLVNEVRSSTREQPFNGPKVCPVCPYDTAPDKWAFRQHLESHLAQALIVNGWKCAYCLYTSEKTHSLTAHLRMYHVQEPPRRIVVGDPSLLPANATAKPAHNIMEETILPEDSTGLEYTEEVLQTLRDHIKCFEDYDKGQPFKGSMDCQICPYKNARGPWAMRKHLESHMAASAITDGWRCAYCLYTCVIPNGVTAHLKKYHPRYAPKRIKIGNPKATPGSSFNPSNDSDNESNEDQYTVYDPDRKYTEEILTKLKEKIAEIQDDNTPYTGSRRCIACPYRCGHSSKSALRDHLQNHITQASLENGWKCGYCLYASDHRGSMTTHLKKYHPGLPHEYVTFGDPLLVPKKGSRLSEMDVLKRSERTPCPVKRLIDDIGDFGDCGEKEKRNVYGIQISSVIGSDGSTAATSVDSNPQPDLGQEATTEVEEYTRSLYCRKDAATNTYSCLNCSFADDDPAGVYSHFCTQHRDECPFQCGYCDYRSITVVKISQHCELSHVGKSVKVTPVVNNSQPVTAADDDSNISDETSSVDGLSTYTIECGDDIYMCSICGIECTGRVEVKQHLLTAHLDRYAFKCKHCEYAASDASKVQRHTAKVHPALDGGIIHREPSASQSEGLESDPMQQDTGEVLKQEPGVYQTPMAVEMYKKTKGSPSKVPQDWSEPSFNYNHLFRCAECNYSSKWQLIDVKIHVLARHLQLRQFSCRYCAFGSRSRGELESHYNTNHRADPGNALQDWEVLQTALYVKYIGKAAYVGIGEYANIIKMTYQGNIINSKVDTVVFRQPKKRIRTSMGRIAQPPDTAVPPSPRFTSTPSSTVSVGSSSNPDMSNFLQQPPLEPASPVYQCTVCNDTHAEKTRIQYHITVEHLYMNPFVCYWCEFGAKTQGEVENHIMYEHPQDQVRVKFEYLEHPAVQAYIAQVNPGQRSAQVIRHKAKNQQPKQPKPPKGKLCMVCKIRCPSMEALGEHVAQAHKDYNGLRCSYCGAYLKDKYILRAHFKTLHADQEVRYKVVKDGMVVGNTLTVIPIGVGGRRYRNIGFANIAKKSFTATHKDTKPDLRALQRMAASGDDHVGLAYEESAYAKAMRESRITGSVVELHCNSCSYQTKSHKLIKIHCKRHMYAKDQPYRCGYCPYKAVSQQRIRRHQKRRHRNQPHKVLGNEDPSLNIMDFFKVRVKKDGVYVDQPETASPSVNAQSQSSINYPVIQQSNRQHIPTPPGTVPDRQIQSQSSSIYSINQQSHRQHISTPSLTVPERQVQSHYRASDSPNYASDTQQSQASEGSSEKNEVFICILCGQYRDGRTDCLHHIMYELEYRPWSCPHCTFTDVTLLNVKRHCFSAHPGREFRIVIKKEPEKMMKIHSLLESSRVSTTQEGDIVHVSADEERPPSSQIKTEKIKLFECTYCPATASDFDELSRHMTDEHETPRPFGDHRPVNIQPVEQEPSERPQPRIKLEPGHRPTEDAPLYGQLTIEPVSMDVSMLSGAGQAYNPHHSQSMDIGLDGIAANVGNDDDYNDKHYDNGNETDMSSASGIRVKHVRGGDNRDEAMHVDVTEGYIGMFDGMAVTEKHLIRESNKIFSCRKCDHTSDKERAVSHYVRCHGPLRWKCPYCNFKNSITPHVRRHIKARHAGRKVHVVSVDPSSNSAYLQRRLQETPPPAVATPPPSTRLKRQSPSGGNYNKPGPSSSKKPRSKGLATLSSQPTMFCCFQCSFKTDNTAELIAHQRRHAAVTVSDDDADRPSSSSSRPSSSSTRGRHKRNMSSSTPDVAAIDCPHCSYTARSMDDLRQHNSDKHLYLRPFKCGYCDFSAFARTHVQKHLDNIHPDELEWVVDQAEVADVGGMNSPRTTRKGNSTSQRSSTSSRRSYQYGEDDVVFVPE